MTSRERVLTALRCEQPDRVPFLETLVDVEFALKYLGLPIPNNLSPLDAGDDPVIIADLCAGPGYDSPMLCDALGLDGQGISFWIRHFGVSEEAGGHSMLSGGSIKSVADVDKIQLPDPHDPDLYKPITAFVEKHRDSGRALFAVLNLGSDPVILGMGFQNFAMAVYTQPELIEALMDLYTDWYAQAIPHLIDCGVDFLWTTDDIAYKQSTYISPDHTRSLLSPYYKRVAEKISIPWIFHSDGDLSEILDDLVDLGMSGLHPLEPGGMELDSVKKRYGTHLCLCGHIDVDHLSQGTTQQVAQFTKDTLDVAKPGGGYIGGSSNSITHYCRPENVRVMRDAIYEYGRYDL